MSYKGRFSPKHPEKYRGNPTDIIYRSLWERQVFKWCDNTDAVIEWSSETTVIPYKCRTDGKMHRYFCDLTIKFKNGKKLLVEIKPRKQTLPPEKKKRVTKAYLAEVMQYAKNISKWEAAKEYADERGWEFKIWDEEFLRKELGLSIL
jgi:hypothetical protein